MEKYLWEVDYRVGNTYKTKRVRAYTGELAAKPLKTCIDVRRVYEDKDALTTYVLEQYNKVSSEFTSWLYDVPVLMPKRDVLASYMEVIRTVNGDMAGYCTEAAVSGQRADVVFAETLPSVYDEILDGNARMFLESFNDREKETGMYRIIDDGKYTDNEGNEHVTGEKLQFIW